MKKHLFLLNIIFVSCTLYLLSSCGFYSFGSGGNIDPDVKSVTVRNFPNQASIVAPLLSQVFTEKMQDKFANETRLDLVQFDGDMEFSGAITNYSIQPVASGGGDQANLSRLNIAVRVEYINRVTEEEWTDTFSAFEDFDKDSNLADVEDELIELITDQLVDKIFNKTLLNW